MSDAHHRVGLVAIVGKPNVGKSTLLNHVVGQKISITSRRPQTTRQRITGILTRPDAQLVFVDTPGFQTEHRSVLTRLMNRSVRQALEDVSVVTWVVEALRADDRDEALLGLLPAKTPVILAINKMDRVKDKRLLLPFIAKWSARREFAAVVPIAAERGRGLDTLVEEIARLLPEGPPLYEADEITTLSERTLAAELVREKLFRQLGDELPYAAAVEIERFETAGSLRRIHVAILVEKTGHKAIIIGKGGERLKAIGTQARQDMEKLFGGKVYVEIWVRVRSGWADDARALKRLGIDGGP